jgi:hypothetical protein
MLKKHKNGFLDVIRKNNFDPKRFEATDDEKSAFEPFVLQMRDSPMKFIARTSNEDFNAFDCAWTKFAPNFPLTKYTPNGWGEIDLIYQKFEEWLRSDVSNYISETMTPNLWEQINLQQPIISGSVLEGDDFSDFTDEEKAQLRLALSEFRALIIENLEPTEEQLKIIDARLSYVADALDRLNRFDWRSILISTVFSISVALSLDTTRGKILFDLLKGVFSNVVYLLK